MGLTKAILKFAAPIPKIEEQERFLFIGPHPDDIEIGAGATAAKLVDMGKEVRFLVCIDGRFGTGNAPEGVVGDELVALRQKEAKNSAAKLGVTNVHFLNLKDGGFYEQKELILGIAKEVGDFQPDAIFTCHLSQFPKGCGDAHSIPLYLKLRSVDFGIRSLKGCAEGFRVLGVTQMHCLPEAGK